MRTALRVAAVILFVYGLHWIGQGTGILPWPAHTLMDNNIAFAYGGAALCVAALAMLWRARRA
jgi:uncharacterized membrane protein